MADLDFIALLGEPVGLENLRLPKAQALAKLLSSDRPYPFTVLIECRTVIDESYHEVIIFDAEVEVSQRPANDIRRVERIAAVFREGDSAMPEVWALRSSFPDVPHLNVMPAGLPKSLCLTDQRYPEVKLRWTASAFVESIREWLKLTAVGQLHQDDQPLEPLLGGTSVQIILPSDLFSTGVPEPLFCHIVSEDKATGNLVVMADRKRESMGVKDAREFRAIPLTVPVAFTHGVIRWQPATLKDLAGFLAEAGYDLLDELRQRLKAWVSDADLLAKVPIFVMAVQKRRTDIGPVESSETWAFAASCSLGEVGKAIGIFGNLDNTWGLDFAPDKSLQGEAVQLELMLPYFRLSRETAAKFNGRSAPYIGNIVAIGLGALGSQVFDNLARTGFGEWTIVDNDRVLPHNLARHELHGNALGYPKVVPLAANANRTIDGEPVAFPLIADILDPGVNAVELASRLGKADLILDMSASVAASRHLARDRDEVSARRLSLFLNPAGTDLVLLAEDGARRNRLDALEMQYYRAVASDPVLARHLRLTEGRLRYGRSCRDTSVVLPQDQVALHAAIGSRAVVRTEGRKEAAIRIWRADDPDLQVRLVDVSVAPVVEERVGGWMVCTDEKLLYKVRSLRRAHLPNETGGILIGSFDMERRIVYVVDTVPSPPDSVEQPTLYIRGYAGLREEVARVAEATAGRLGYAGEWHSHPPDCSADLGNDDRRLFGWLEEEMATEGHPPVMLIMGEADLRWYVEALPSNPAKG